MAALVVAVLPTIPRPSPGTYPPLSMTYRVEMLTGSLAGGTWITQRFHLEWQDADHWSVEVLESDDPKPGSHQAGELLVVDGGSVEKRPCGDCASDTRNRTNETLPPEVSPDVYRNLGSNPTLPTSDAPRALGVNRPSVFLQAPAPYPCAGLWAECAPGAPNQPADLSDGTADTSNAWRFVVFGDESGVPVAHDMSVGDTVVYRYGVEQLGVPSS